MRPAEIPLDGGEPSGLYRRNDDRHVMQHDIQRRHLKLEPTGHSAHVVPRVQSKDQ